MYCSASALASSSVSATYVHRASLVCAAVPWPAAWRCSMYDLATCKDVSSEVVGMINGLTSFLAITETDSGDPPAHHRLADRSWVNCGRNRTSSTWKCSPWKLHLPVDSS